jgi:hypothetical protein
MAALIWKRMIHFNFSRLHILSTEQFREIRNTDLVL